MPLADSDLSTAEDLARELLEYIEQVVRENGGSTQALRPQHRKPFHWPPHPVSYSYHVLASDWTGRASFEAHGERFEVEVAKTPFGVFGRCPAVWHEERGESEEEMLQVLREGTEPLFQRQITISKCLGRPGRFTEHIKDLEPLDLLKLLYCPDRDVANDAKTVIEAHARSGIFTPSLIAILLDRKHPHRRSAQWAVLDLFEDLPSFCHSAEIANEAVQAMKGVLWDAEDDYARTVYKAGVVLGGHLPAEIGGPVLLECLEAPSKIGRRSAIHGLFHVVEWHPDSRSRVVAALKHVSESDPEPKLREYAAHIASDIGSGGIEHVTEPLFEDEP